MVDISGFQSPRGSIINIDELRRIGPPISHPPQPVELLTWLTQKHPFFSENEWSEQIASGKIYINQRIVTDIHFKLSLKDQIARIHPLPEEPNVDTNLEVIWQDDHIAVINKPAGLPMHESASFRRKTFQWQLQLKLGTNWDAAHRLDRETSGAILCGSTSEIRKKLAQDFENSLIKKTYLALVQGEVKAYVWTNNRAIIPASGPHGRAQCVDSNFPSAKAAQTNFSIMKSFDKNLHLVAAQPITGRTHQIRVHLSDSGLPIVGDKIYGPDENLFQDYIRDGNTLAICERAGAPTHRLHAWKLEFVHPVCGMSLAIECPMPHWAKS